MKEIMSVILSPIQKVTLVIKLNQCNINNVNVN